MGWTDVLPRLPLLLWRARQIARAILAAEPDVVVLVDAQVFSQTVAAQVRKAGCTHADPALRRARGLGLGPGARARSSSRCSTKCSAVLPFEPEVMARSRRSADAAMSGTPALEHGTRAASSVPETGPLLLLPGSRERRAAPPSAADPRRRRARWRSHPRVTRLRAADAQGRRADASARLSPTGRCVSDRHHRRRTPRRTLSPNAVAAVAVMGTVDAGAGARRRADGRHLRRRSRRRRSACSSTRSRTCRCPTSSSARRWCPRCCSAPARARRAHRRGRARCSTSRRSAATQLAGFARDARGDGDRAARTRRGSIRPTACSRIWRQAASAGRSARSRASAAPL